MNVHDSERLAGLLEQEGYAAAAESAQADVVVLNTCSVRERAEDKLYSRLGELRSSDNVSPQTVVVAGCVAQQEGARLLKRSGLVDIVLGTQSLKQLPELLARHDRSIRPLVDIDGRDDVSYPLGVVHRGDATRAYVTIVEGCNDFCAFCIVPYTRGHERMRATAEILAEVRHAALTGRREILLLGQIVNHYQAPDLDGCDFSALLRLVAAVPGVERVRFASPHPRHVTTDMVRAMADTPQVCRHLHLPVQSGSTRVLTAMRRRYSREEYLELVSRLRRAMPDLALTTDMIIGFPGETDADFEETMTLLDEVRFQGVFSFKYSPRPNTLAGRQMADDVPESVKADRLTRLQTRQRTIRLEHHEALMGARVAVLVEGLSKRRPGDVTGRTPGNTLVNFPGSLTLVGRTVTVHVRRAGPNAVWGTAEAVGS